MKKLIFITVFFVAFNCSYSISMSGGIQERTLTTPSVSGNVKHTGKDKEIEYLYRYLFDGVKIKPVLKIKTHTPYSCSANIYFNDLSSYYNFFASYDIEDKFLMQEFFNQMKIVGNASIISGQCSPENWDSLFEVKSFAQSIRGRLLEHSYRLELKGPNLRMYSPAKA